MAASPVARLRKICLALPEAHEVEAWQTPTFRVKGKMFAMFIPASDKQAGGRPAVWCKASPTEQQLLIASDGGRFFSPPYVGHKGWVGIWLDAGCSWTVVRDLVQDSWSRIAPARIRRLVTGP